MRDILNLIEADRANPKRIAVIGDTMLDNWVFGHAGYCQDDCPKALVTFKAVSSTPGGAAGAARQLLNWNSHVSLIGPTNADLECSLSCSCRRVDAELAFVCHDVPVKTRYLNNQGRVLFRADWEPVNYLMHLDDLLEARDLALKAIRTMPWDAVLLVDYAKGFLNGRFIQDIIKACRERGISVVADPKRSPQVFKGAVLKVNQAYAEKYHWELTDHAPVVVTRGALFPSLAFETGGYETIVSPLSGHLCCVNHIGAGDCFGAHLALALAHGMELRNAVRVADAAARVYVQHTQGRPPWPHEIARQVEPVRGKVVSAELRALRESVTGRMVFANGVFRLPHAGHAWLLDWARQQGDVLIVGINTDYSAARLRPGEYIMPLAERIEMLAGLSCVDWVVPYCEDTPEAVLEGLMPDVLVKGSEYDGTSVPGDQLVSEVRFAPKSPFPDHCTHKIEVIRGG